MTIVSFNSALSSHMVLVGKPEGKRPLGRPRRRWKDNVMGYLAATTLDNIILFTLHIYFYTLLLQTLNYMEH
jgi:hypothetical protein